MHFVKQKYKLEWKRNGIEIGKSHIVLKTRTVYLSSCKIRKLKVKLWWVGTRERKKRRFLYCLSSPKELFLTYVFYFNVKCIKYTFREYLYFYTSNALHIPKSYSET